MNVMNKTNDWPTTTGDLAQIAFGQPQIPLFLVLGEVSSIQAPDDTRPHSRLRVGS